MSDPITSLQNPRIKALVKLRDKGPKDRAEHILIDGIREITRAIEAGVELSEAFYCPRTSVGAVRGGTAHLGAALEACRTRGVPCIEVADTVLQRISYGERREGIVVTAVRPKRPLDQLRIPERPLIGVVERIEKPGNLGAILRCADGAGVDAIVAADAVTDVYGPNVIRSSVGAVFSVQVVEASSADVMVWIRAKGMQIVAAVPVGDRRYTDVDYRMPTAIVFGSEAQGLSKRWHGAGVVTAKVPMAGKGDSLNVSATAATFFYEARRQRGAV